MKTEHSFLSTESSINFEDFLKIVVALEGLIGVGKSTACQCLLTDYNVVIFDESISPEILQLFYQDPKKYGFTFQYGQLKTRKYQLALAQHVKSTSRAPPHALNLWDRSMVGDYIFALWNHLSGNITREEMNVYENEFGGSLKNVKSIKFLECVDVMLYLYDSPISCKRRAEIRGDKSEGDIPIEYFEGLDHVHFAIILKLIQYKIVPVKVLFFGDFNASDQVLTHIQHARDGIVGSVVEEPENIEPPKDAHIVDSEAGIDVLAGVMPYSSEDFTRCYTSPLYIKRELALVDPQSIGVIPDHGYPIRFHKEKYRYLVMMFLRKGADVHFY